MNNDEIRATVANLAECGLGADDAMQAAASAHRVSHDAVRAALEIPMDTTQVLSDERLMEMSRKANDESIKTGVAPSIAYGRAVESAVLAAHAQQVPAAWAVHWLRNNYQDHPNIDSLCQAMLSSAPPVEAQPQWQPIETAPRGSGEAGPSSVNDPAYIEPPKILLWTEEGPVVGYYDWYYHEGYGRGAEPGVSAWRSTDGGQAYGPTHWMPLPTAPAHHPEKAEGGGA